MANGFTTLAVAFIITGLFAVAMLSFTAQIELDSGVNDTIFNEPVINSTFSGLKTNISQSEEDVKSIKESFETSNPLLAVGELIFGSIITAATTIGSAIVGTYDVIGVLGVYLGIPAVVFQVLTTILLILLVFLAWRLLKTGE